LLFPPLPINRLGCELNNQEHQRQQEQALLYDMANDEAAFGGKELELAFVGS
jgi:hypothetical protein